MLLLSEAWRRHNPHSRGWPSRLLHLLAPRCLFCLSRLACGTRDSWQLRRRSAQYRGRLCTCSHQDAACHWPCRKRLHWWTRGGPIRHPHQQDHAPPRLPRWLPRSWCVLYYEFLSEAGRTYLIDGPPLRALVLIKYAEWLLRPQQDNGTWVVDFLRLPLACHQPRPPMDFSALE
jgi:hypothetical protein